MAIWYSLWSFVIFFPIWYVWTKRNLATLATTASFQAKRIFQKNECSHFCFAVTDAFNYTHFDGKVVLKVQILKNLQH
jgi:hypothetical protein